MVYKLSEVCIIKVESHLIFQRRLSEVPGLIKTEEIVQGFVGWTWLNKNRRTYYKELRGSLFSTKEISMKKYVVALLRNNTLLIIPISLTCWIPAMF